MKPELWSDFISTALLAVHFAIEHWDSISAFFGEYIVRRLFVDIWFVWAGVFAYGLYLFVRFQLRLASTIK